MGTIRAVALVAVAVLGVVAVVSVAGAAAATLDDGDDPDSAENASLGVQTGSFMQASSAGTESAVSEGMFEAEYDNAADEGAVLDDRATGLEARLTALEQQKEQLEADEDDDVRTQVQMSRVASQVHALEREVSNSAERAQQADHTGAPFDDLTQDVAELRGPDIAAAAGTIPGGPPAEDVGPPADVPGQNGDSNQQDDAGPPADSGHEDQGSEERAESDKAGQPDS